MSAQELITEHLDLWTGAVRKKSSSGRGSNGKVELTGVTKLRELILELAVRGKLVEQSPTDEPATQLLNKTKASREQLIREGKLRRMKKNFSAEDIDKPFEIPAGWSWATLPDIASFSPGKTPSTKAPKFWASGAPGIPWVSIADLNHSGTIRDTTKAVTQTAADEVFRSEPVAPGTILMSFKLTVGKVSVTEVPVYHNEAIISIFPFNGVSRDYLFKVMPMLALAGNTKRAIMGNTLNATSLAQILVPLPPEEEQRRIVQKVDELMALCDLLEQQTSDQLEAHETLVDTLLGTLIQSENASELADNWARLAAHFDTLFTTEQSIDKLKQTILQLAVMGRLVKQKTTEAPPKKLIESISVERQELVASGKLRKPKAPTRNGVDRPSPFPVPKSWRWAQLDELFAIVTDGDHQAPPKSEDGIPFLVIGNLNTGRINFADCKHVTENYYSKLDWGRKPTNGDLLYTVTGSYGIPIKVLTTKTFCVQRHVAILRATASTPLDYVQLALESEYGKSYADQIATGIAQKTVPLTGLRKMPIPLPPLAEQHRIVQKADELIALCDQLKERLNLASETRCQIAEAVMEGALN